MRKYTRKCEFPRAEIHAEMCITACGNTLNQVQDNYKKDRNFNRRRTNEILRPSWIPPPPPCMEVLKRVQSTYVVIILIFKLF